MWLYIHIVDFCCFLGDRDGVWLTCNVTASSTLFQQEMVHIVGDRSQGEDLERFKAQNEVKLLRIVKSH